MNWIFMILIASISLASSLSAADMKTSIDVSKSVLLDIHSSGKKIEANVGSEIQVELQGIGGTGYSWYLDSLTPDFFERISEEIKGVNKRKDDMTGSPVQYSWRFKAKKPGTVTIRMDYYRIWEGKEKAIQRFEVTVDIRP